MFRKLKKLKEDLQKKAEEATKEVLKEKVGIEWKEPEKPKRMVEVPATHPPTEIDEHLRELVLDEIHSWRAGIEAFQKRIYHLRVDEEDRPVAVFTALEAMASKRFPDFLAGGGGFDKEAASYFESSLDPLSGEFMHEYRKAKAELLRHGIRTPSKGGIFPDLGRDAAPIDSPIGDWQGKFWRHKFVSSIIYKDTDPNSFSIPAENNIKISITRLQTKPYGGRDIVISGDMKTAFARQLQDEVFICLNDDQIRKIGPPHIYDRTGATLFERRRFLRGEEALQKTGLGKFEVPDIDLGGFDREVREKGVWADFQETEKGVRVIIQKGGFEETINVPREQDKMPIDKWAEEEARRIKEMIREIAESMDVDKIGVPYEAKAEADFSMLSPSFFMNAQLEGGMSKDGIIRAKGTADWGTKPGSTDRMMETFVSAFGKDSQREAMLKAMRESPEWEEQRKEWEKKLAKRPDLEQFATAPPERKTKVELTSRIHTKEGKLTNRITGTLRPIVPTEEITVGEYEGEFLKVKLGEMDFTLYKTTP